jgi:hypothetical protein
VGLACAACYYGIASVREGLWPESSAPLKLAVVVFVSTATGYTLQNTLLMFIGHVDSTGRITRAADKIVVLYSQAAATCIFLLWIAMAGA